MHSQARKLSRKLAGNKKLEWTHWDSIPSSLPGQVHKASSGTVCSAIQDQIIQFSKNTLNS